MDFITPPAVLGILTYGIYKMFELFVCRRERMAIIEKLTDDQLRLPLDKLPINNLFPPRFSFGALKAGCLLIGIGLGLLIGFIICSNCIPNYFDRAESWQFRQMESIIYGSGVLLFGGIGLIVAFVIELKTNKAAARSGEV